MDQPFHAVESANPLAALNDYELRYIAEHLALAGNGKQSLLLMSNILFIEALASRRLLTHELLASQSRLLDLLGEDAQSSSFAKSANECLSFARSELDLLAIHPELTLQQAANQRRYERISTSAEAFADRLALRPPWIRWKNAFSQASIDVRITKHSDWVIGCRAGDDSTAISLDSAGVLLQWNTDTGVVVRSCRLPSSRSAFLSPSGEKAVLLKEAQAFVCETTYGNELARVGIDQGSLKWATWSLDEQLIVVATDSNIYLWDQNLQRLSLLLGDVDAGRERGSLNPRSDRLLTLSLPPVVWDVERRAKVAELGEARWVTDGNIHSWTVFRGHRRGVNVGAWSPDGKIIATAGGHGYGLHDDDFSVRLWSTETYDEVAVLRGHADRVTCLAWTSDSRLLASGSGSVLTPAKDNSVRVWNINEKQQSGSVAAHSGEVTDCTWSTDDSHLFTASKDTSAVVCRPGQAVSSGLEAVVSSPDGALIAGIGLAGALFLFDGAGQVVSELRGHTDDITACAWSPDSSMLATGSHDRTVRIWNVLNHEDVHVLSGHQGVDTYTPGGQRTVWGSVTGLCWNPTGERLASSSTDRSIIIWNPTSGEQVARLLGHEGPVGSCAWSFDGSRIISRGARFEHIVDLSVRSWNALAGFELGIIPDGDIDQHVLGIRESCGTQRGFTFAPRRWSVRSADGLHVASVKEIHRREYIVFVDRLGASRAYALPSGPVDKTERTAPKFEWTAPKVEWTADARHCWAAFGRSVALMSIEDEQPICVFPFSTNVTDFCLLKGGAELAAVDAAGFLYMLEVKNFDLGPSYIAAMKTWLFEAETWSNERWGRCPVCGMMVVARSDSESSEPEHGRCDGCGSGYRLRTWTEAPATFTFTPKVTSDPEAWLRVARGLLINSSHKVDLIQYAFKRVVELDHGERVFKTRIVDPYLTDPDGLNSALWSVAAGFLLDDPAVASKCRATAESLEGRRT